MKLALIIACIFLISILTACSGQQAGDAAPQEQVQEQQQKIVEDTTNSPAEVMDVQEGVDEVQDLNEELDTSELDEINQDLQDFDW